MSNTTTSTKPTFLSIISRTDKQKSQEATAYDCEQAQLSLAANKSETRRVLSEKKNQRLSFIKPGVNWNALATLDQEIKGYEAGLAQLEAYEKEYFPA